MIVLTKEQIIRNRFHTFYCKQKALTDSKICFNGLFIFRMFFKKIWFFFQNFLQQLLIPSFSNFFSKFRHSHRTVIDITNIVYFFWR